MKSIKFLPLSLVFLFSFGCANERDFVVKFEQLKEGDKLVIRIPNGYVFDRDYKWGFSNSNEGHLLVRFSNLDDRVIINTLNLNSLSMNPTLSIPKQGPNGFKSPSPSVYYHRSDSVFVLITSLNQILMYNSDGEKRSQINIQSDLPLSIEANEDQQSFALINNRLVGHAVPYLNPNAKDFFDKTSSHISVDLSNGGVTGIPYDPELFGKVLPTDFLGGQVIGLNESEYLFSNHYAHTVRLYNIKTGLYKSLDFGLSELGEFKPRKTLIDNGSFEKALMVLRSPKYYGIVHDHSNGVIYRFVQILNPKYQGLSDPLLTDELVNNNQDLIKNVVIATNRDFSAFRYFEIPRHGFYAPFRDGLLTSSSIEPSLEEETFLFYDLRGIIDALSLD